MNNLIKSPVTSDGLCGYDEYKQFRLGWRDGDRTCYTIGWDVRGRTCLLCNKKWEATSESLVDQYYDNAIEQVVHKSCYVRVVGYQDLAAFHVVLGEAGYRREFVEHLNLIPSQYGGAWNIPWYEVALKTPNQATLICGQRRRVFSIKATRLLAGQPEKIHAVLAKESTTTEKTFDTYLIHAHGKADAVKYLKTILEVIHESTVPTGAEGKPEEAVPAGA